MKAIIGKLWSKLHKSPPRQVYSWRWEEFAYVLRKE